jgi:hypothetical protein
MDEELKRHLADMEARMVTMVKGQVGELKSQVGELKTQMGELKSHVDDRCEKVETNLLAAFHGWARSMEIRVRGVSGVTMGFDERLALAEERISDLERKKAS